MTSLSGIAFTTKLLLQFNCMNKAELAPILDHLLPKLFSFAYSLIPDELQAEQMVIDAYSVFIILEKERIESYQLDSTRRGQRTRFKRFLLKGLLRDILKIALKRSPQLGQFKSGENYQEFYLLDISERATLYMRDILGLDLDEVQEVMQFKKHQAIEKVYNARNNLIIAANNGVEANGSK